MHTPDNSLLVTGASEQSDSWGDPFVFKIDPCGELEWCKIWSVPLVNYGAHILNTVSGNIIIHTRYAGDPSGYPPDRFELVELDAGGNILWIKQIMPQSEYPDIINEDMYCLINTSDGGFLFGGKGYFQDTSGIDLYWLQNMLVKCDANGDEEWVKGYFKQDDEEEIRGKIGAVYEFNGNYYAGGTRYIQYGSSTIASTPVLIKVDNSGQMLERFHILGDSLVFSLPWAFDVINESMVLMATRTTPSVSQILHIGLIMTDTLGNIKKALDSYNGYLVEDCLARSDDGKYLLTGGNNVLNDYNGYAMKVNAQLEWDTIYSGQFTYDSLCPHAIDSTTVICNCDITTGIQKPIPVTKETSLTIYPNPASDRVAVLLPAVDGNITIRVTDLFGRLMLEKECKEGDKEAILDIEGLHEGYYIVTLVQKNQIIQSGKFLKKNLKF